MHCLPKQLEGWRVCIRDPRRFGWLVADYVDLDFRVVDLLSDVTDRPGNTLARQDVLQCSLLSF
jgi:hypothetical protein